MTDGWGFECVSVIVSEVCVLSPFSQVFVNSFCVQAFMSDCLSLGAVWVRQCSYVLAVSDSLPVSVGICLCQSVCVVSQALTCSVLLLLSSLCRLHTCLSECSAPNWFLSSQRPHNFVAPRNNHLSPCLCLNLSLFLKLFILK